MQSIHAFKLNLNKILDLLSIHARLLGQTQVVQTFGSLESD